MKTLPVLLLLSILLVAGCSQQATAEPDDDVYLPLIGNDMWSPSGQEETLFDFETETLTMYINDGHVNAKCTTGGVWLVEPVYGQDGLDKQVVLLGVALKAELDSELSIWAENVAVVMAYNHCIATVTKQ